MPRGAGARRGLHAALRGARLLRPLAGGLLRLDRRARGLLRGLRPGARGGRGGGHRRAPRDVLHRRLRGARRLGGEGRGVPHLPPHPPGRAQGRRALRRGAHGRGLPAARPGAALRPLPRARAEPDQEHLLLRRVPLPLQLLLRAQLQRDVRRLRAQPPPGRRHRPRGARHPRALAPRDGLHAGRHLRVQHPVAARVRPRVAGARGGAVALPDPAGAHPRRGAARALPRGRLHRDHPRDRVGQRLPAALRAAAPDGRRAHRGGHAQGQGAGARPAYAADPGGALQRHRDRPGEPRAQQPHPARHRVVVDPGAVPGHQHGGHRARLRALRGQQRRPRRELLLPQRAARDGRRARGDRARGARRHEEPAGQPPAAHGGEARGGPSRGGST